VGKRAKTLRMNLLAMKRRKLLSERLVTEVGSLKPREEG